MKTLLYSLLLISFCSCTVYQHEASVTTKSGVIKYEKDTLIQGPGGTSSQKGADGSTLVTDNQQSARDLANAGVSGYGLHEARLTNLDNNAKDVKIGQQGVQTHAIDHPITTTTETIDQGTGTVLTNTVQSVPKFGAGTHK